MIKRNHPLKDYVANLVLMNAVMGELISQLQEIAIEEMEKNNNSSFE